MGSAHYKRELVKLTSHLRESEQSALEWEKVANLRLRQIISLDEAASVMVRDISSLGRVIGVSIPDTELPDAILSVNGSGETTSFVRGKLAYMAQFMRCLVSEARGVQSVLDSALSIALSAAEVSRPLLDIDDSSGKISLDQFRLAGDLEESEHSEPNTEVEPPQSNHLQNQANLDGSTAIVKTQTTTRLFG